MVMKYLGYLLIIMLAACAPVALWTQPGVSDEQSIRDLANCQNQAKQQTPRPSLSNPPAFGDGQLTSAENGFINYLIDFFIAQLKEIESRNSDTALSINFGASEFSLLRSELEKTFYGTVIYQSSAEELSMQVKDIFLRILTLIRSSPEVDLVAVWDEWDKPDPFTIGEEQTSTLATKDALSTYNERVEEYLDQKDQPFIDQYNLELLQTTNRCMENLGYQPKQF